MFSLSPIKIVVIVAVILIVLGPDKLPEVSNQIGSAWRTLREWQAKVEKEVRDVVPDLPSTSDIARLARSPVNLLNSLADRASEPLTFDTTSTPPVETDARFPPENDEPPEWPAFDANDPSNHPPQTIPHAGPPVADPSLN